MHFDVIIIGGGTAGISCANQLFEARPKLKIAVVDPRSYHAYQPGWSSGLLRARPQRGLIPKPVTWIRDAVERLDPKRLEIETSRGWTLTYEFLIVAPGIQNRWDRITGLDDLGCDGICSVYADNRLPGLVERVLQGNVVFTLPSTPVKGPGAPIEVALLAADRLRRRGVRGRVRVLFVAANDDFFPAKEYTDPLRQLFRDRDVEVVTGYELIEVRPKSKEAVFWDRSGNRPATLPYAVLHVTPPMATPPFVFAGGLADRNGLADVLPDTLRHIRFVNVFGLGDASNIPTLKSGNAAQHQAHVVVNNVLAALEDQPLEARYDGHAECSIATGSWEAIRPVHRYTPEPVEDLAPQSRLYLADKIIQPTRYWSSLTTPSS